MLKKFNIQAIKEGNFQEVTSFAKDAIKNKDMKSFMTAIDFAAQNEDFIKRFEAAFNTEWTSVKDSNNGKVSFKALEEEQIEEQYKKFDITQTSVQTIISTTIMPTVEKLIRSNELLSRISIENVTEDKNVQLYDFDQEQDAAILTEVAAGTDVDEVLRQGDLLIPNQKIQASMKISEFALNTMNAGQFGTFMARLARRVQTRAIVAILANGAAAANGTARGSNIRGILNNYGINGTGDDTSAIGAISYATKAAADTAIVAAGGVASTDAYDLCLKVKALLLPSNIQDAEESDWVYVTNRNTWGAVRTVLDSTGRSKARSQWDAATGKVVRSIDDSEVLLVPRVACPDGRVYLIPPKFYKLIVNGSLLNLNDGGIVEIRQGLYSFVSRMWASGSMEYGQKFRPTTAVTIGTTAPDNADQNAFRVFNIT